MNCIGHAVSTNGIHFSRLDRPVMAPGAVPQEARGCEDGRLVKIGDTYHLTYTGFGNRFDGDYRICRATSKSLIAWERHGVVLDEPNKNASLFPELVGGRYYMLHCRHPDIWVASSDDLRHKRILSPLPGTWQDARVGIADNSYRLGAALLDLEDPTIVLARQAQPIIDPELPRESVGLVPDVIFSNGHALRGNELLYYGGADTVIGVAGLQMDNIRF